MCKHSVYYQLWWPIASAVACPHGPDDDLLLRSKHVAFYIIKLAVLDVKVFFSYF